MKNLLVAALFITTSGAYAQNKPVAQNKPNAGKKEAVFVLDAQASSAKWHGHKVASSHTGAVSFKEGEFIVKNGSIKSGKISIDLNTITNEDLTDKDYNTKLVNHLKSEDFFDAAKFPTAEFKLTKFSEVHNIVEGQPNAEAVGVFTIRGKTSKPKKLKLFYTPKDGSFEISGKIEIDRTEFGLKYNSKKFFSLEKLGDKLIKDNFDVEVKIVANVKN